MTRTNGKRWSYLAGEKGANRVRVYEHHRTGGVYLEVREHGRRVRVALGHRDREAAKAKAEEVAAALRHSATLPRAPEPTLRELFDNYLAEVSPGKSESARQHDHRAARLFLECFGAERKASTLNRRDWDAFITWRRRRGDTRVSEARGRPLNGRAVELNLKFLTAVLNWATTVRDRAGRFLLDRNPLKGMPWPRVTDVRRPVITAPYFEALASVAHLVNPRAPLLLTLARETGHRIGAIRHLRWADLDLAAGTVRWRSEHDKTRRAHETPLSEAALNALQAARRSHVGDGWIFPSPTDAGQPVSKSLARDWWREMERHAGLPPERGRGWHSLRRAFATELKALPLADLCALGGWKDPQTVLKCYQRPDLATQRRALEQRAQLGSGGLEVPATGARTDTPSVFGALQQASAGGGS